MTTTLPSANPGILSFGTVIASPSPSPVVDKRYGGFCPSYVSTWGVDGQHFTQYATYVSCAGTPTWASFATHSPAATGSAHVAQDAGFRFSHAQSLGMVIGFPVGVPILLAVIGVAFWFWKRHVKKIAEAEKQRLKEKYLERGKQEIRAGNQAPAPAQLGQVATPPNNPQI